MIMTPLDFAKAGVTVLQETANGREMQVNSTQTYSSHDGSPTDSDSD